MCYLYASPFSNVIEPIGVLIRKPRHYTHKSRNSNRLDPLKAVEAPLEKRGEIWYNGRIGGTESAAGGKDGTHT